MKNKLKAVLVGGKRDGETLMLDEAYPRLSAVIQRMNKEGGGFEEIYKSDYKLVSEGPPLRYEAEDSN